MTNLEICHRGFVFTVEVESYTPGTPDVMYLPNGDPGHPGDDEECEYAITGVAIDCQDTVTEEMADYFVFNQDDLWVEVVSKYKEYLYD